MKNTDDLFSVVWEEEPIEKAIRDDKILKSCFLYLLGGLLLEPLICIAAESGATKCLKFLSKTSFNVNVRESKNGCTPLHSIVSFCNLDRAEEIDDCLKHLIKNGANINAKEFLGHTPLHYAVLSGSTALAQILIDNSAYVNAKNKKGQSPLHIIAEFGMFDCIQLLIDSKAGVNALDQDGRTPLHEAARKNTFNCMKLLIVNKAHVNAADHSGQTPLHYTARVGKHDCMQLLIDCKADVNALDQYGDTPLQNAVSNNIDCIKLLIDNKADVNATNRLGNTALHHAAMEGKTNYMKLLIDNKAKVNAKGEDGKTPIIILAESLRTCEEDKIRSLELLIKSGADLTWKDKENKTVLDHLCLYNSIDNSINYSTKLGNIDFMNLHIENGRDVIAPERSCATLMLQSKEQ